MEKINFEDGQLVTAGYVEIEDVKYPITEAEYDGATPLSAFILNKMQENIEKAIGEVSSFDPVIVEELPTENIQEKTMYLVLSNADEEIKKYDAYIYKDNEWKQIGSAELDPSKLTLNLVENSYKVTLTEAVAGGGTITLPCMYKVGSDRLDVYLNGEKLIKAEADDTEGHYYEVGTQGTLSNVIKITSDWTAEIGDVFEFTIRTNGEAEIETGVGEIENGVVLWENPNPTAEISTSGINITLDESLFDRYEVYFKMTTTSTTLLCEKSFKGIGAHLQFSQGENSIYRNITYVSENNYFIDYASPLGITSPELSNYTKYAIPVKIIGYKNTMPAVVVKEITVPVIQEGETTETVKQIVENTLDERGNNEIYSTEEQVIGKWIDGKPLYRKVIVKGVASGETLIELGINNLDYIKDISGTMKYYNSEGAVRFIPISRAHSSKLENQSGWYYTGTANKLALEVGSTYSSYNITATIIAEYTKTTDTGEV